MLSVLYSSCQGLLISSSVNLVLFSFFSLTENQRPCMCLEGSHQQGMCYVENKYSPGFNVSLKIIIDDVLIILCPCFSAFG